MFTQRLESYPEVTDPHNFFFGRVGFPTTQDVFVMFQDFRKRASPCILRGYKESLAASNGLKGSLQRFVKMQTCCFLLSLYICLGTNHIMKSTNIMKCLGILCSPVQKEKVPAEDSLTGGI